MPEMDGFEVTREIKKLNSEIPGVTQTVYALEGEKEECLAAGCNNYISKPIDQKEFLGKIDWFLKQVLL